MSIALIKFANEIMLRGERCDVCSNESFTCCRYQALLEQEKLILDAFKRRGYIITMDMLLEDPEKN